MTTHLAVGFGTCVQTGDAWTRVGSNCAFVTYQVKAEEVLGSGA
jgi:hypothetical protein